MAAFGIPDGGAIGAVMSECGLSAQNGWAIAIEQTTTLAALAALEDRIFRAIERNRDKGWPVNQERERLAMCDARRLEIQRDGEQAAPKWEAKTPYHERRQILEGIPPASMGDVVRP